LIKHLAKSSRGRTTGITRFIPRSLNLLLDASGTHRVGGCVGPTLPGIQSRFLYHPTHGIFTILAQLSRVLLHLR
jgi:hypothetical protein